MNSASAEQAIWDLLQLPVPERQAGLDRAVANDPMLAPWRGHIAAALGLPDPSTSAPLPAASAAGALRVALGLEIEEAAESRIGPYKLLERIGEGGFGVVWLAEQLEPIRRRVAVKVIKAGMDTREVIARFEAERQALALMDHPNIARVLDAGTASSGRPYFAMELVRGVPLTRYCDENRLGPEQRLRLFITVCQAVQHAHQKGVIHRDLKPSNILVTLHDGAPVPKIIDFGIAKATSGIELTDKTLFTRFHVFLGTPVYTSPEQMEMSGLDVDTRSDIYSLGVLLYELMTGRPPFDAGELLRSGLEVMRRTIREIDPPWPSARLDTLSVGDRTTIAQQRSVTPGQLTLLLRGDLDWIVMHCLEKDRTRRYETANELVRDLQRHLANEPVVARPPSAVYRVRKFVRRHRFGVAAALAMVVSLVTALAIASVALLHERAAHGRALIAEKAESRLRIEAENARAREARNASQTALRLANQLFDEGRTAEALAYFVHAARKDPGNRVIGPRLMAALASRNFLLPDGPSFECGSPVLALRCTNDGRSALVGTQDGVLHVFDLTTRAVQRRRPLGQSLHRKGWWFARDDDTRFVVRLASGPLAAVQIEADQLSWTLLEDSAPSSRDENSASYDLREGVDQPVDPVALSADGRWIAAHDSDRLSVWDARSGRRQVTLAESISNCDFSFEGTQCVATGRATLYLWSLPAWVPIRTIPLSRTTPIPAMCARFAPDGRRLVVWDALHPGSLTTYDVASGAELHRWSTGLTFLIASSLQFLPDGRLFAAGMHNSDLWDLDTGRTTPLPFAWRDTFRSNSLSRDGSRVLTSSSDGYARVWSPVTTENVAEPTPHHSGRFVATLSPDGTRVLTGDEHGTVRWFHVGHGAAQPRTDVPPRLAQVAPFLTDEFCRVLAFTGDEDTLTRSVARSDAVLGRDLVVSDTGQVESASLACYLRADRNYAVVRRPDGRWDAWQLGEGTVRRKTPLAGVFPPGLISIVFSPRANRVAHVSAEEINVRELEAGQVTVPPCRHDARFLLLSANFSPDGSRLAVGAMDGSILAWNLGNGDVLRIRSRSPVPVLSVRFDHDGRRLVSANAAHQAETWDVITGMPASPALGSGDANDARFSPDGRYVVTWGARTAQVWDAASGAQVGDTIPMGAGRRRLHFSHDSERIAIGGYDDSVRVWDVATGQPVTGSIRSGNTLMRAFFSEDDRSLHLLEVTNTAAGHHTWGIPPPLPPGTPVPEWLLTLASVCSGKVIDVQEHCIDVPEMANRLDEVDRALAALPADAPLADWGRWFLDRSPSRPLAPGLEQRTEDVAQLRTGERSM